MRIVFMGTPDFAVGALEALAQSGHEIAAVVTQPDKPKGRGKMQQMTPVKETALRLGLPVFQPVRVREEDFVEQMRELAPDVIVVSAFGQIIPGALLELPQYGCINIHASLLPRYRGAAPIQWAVIDGEAVSGVTIMRMDAAALERRIRGFNPWPSAYTSINGKTLKIWKAETADGGSGKEPGTVTAADKKGFCVQTGEGILKVLEVQLQGKKRMDAAAFLRGFQVKPGTRLG